jgi:hypothetical protein
MSEPWRRLDKSNAFTARDFVLVHGMPHPRIDRSSTEAPIRRTSAVPGTAPANMGVDVAAAQEHRRRSSEPRYSRGVPGGPIKLLRPTIAA